MTMSNYRLSPLAEKDLFKIIFTTIKSWGSAQAKMYAQTIDVILLKLAQYPDFTNAWSPQSTFSRAKY
jgi:toxin ParE1/3/4